MSAESWEFIYSRKSTEELDKISNPSTQTVGSKSYAVDVGAIRQKMQAITEIILRRSGTQCAPKASETLPASIYPLLLVGRPLKLSSPALIRSSCLMHFHERKKNAVSSSVSSRFLSSSVFGLSACCCFR